MKSGKKKLLDKLTPDETVRLKLEELRLKDRYATSPWHVSEYLENPDCFKQLLGSYIPSWEDLMEHEHIASLVAKSPALKRFKARARVRRQ